MEKVKSQKKNKTGQGSSIGFRPQFVVRSGLKKGEGGTVLGAIPNGFLPLASGTSSSQKQGTGKQSPTEMPELDSEPSQFSSADPKNVCASASEKQQKPSSQDAHEIDDDDEEEEIGEDSEEETSESYDDSDDLYEDAEEDDEDLIRHCQAHQHLDFPSKKADKKLIIKELQSKLKEQENIINQLQSRNREEVKKNAHLHDKVVQLTEKNQAVEEKFQELEIKYEVDLKEFPVMQAFNQNLSDKLTALKTSVQKFAMDVTGAFNFGDDEDSKSNFSILPSSYKISKKSKYKEICTQTEHDNEDENTFTSKKSESPAPSFYAGYSKIFEENKNNLAVKILEKLPTCQQIEARQVCKGWNQLILPLLHENNKISLDFSYSKNQNVHPLTSDLDREKSLWRNLCQFNKVLQSSSSNVEKPVLDNYPFNSSSLIPIVRFSFDLCTLSKPDFNKGALFKFFTSHLSNFPSIKKLTLCESDKHLTSKVQQEHHEIILRILKEACTKIEELDISELYSTTNRTGIDINSTKYFSKLKELKTNGNLIHLNNWILYSSPHLDRVELPDYKTVESLKVFEERGCLKLIQKMGFKLSTTLSVAQLSALGEFPTRFKLPGLKSIQVSLDETDEDGSGSRQHSGQQENKKKHTMHKLHQNEIFPMFMKILTSVENSLEILEVKQTLNNCSCHSFEFPKMLQLHTLKYLKGAGKSGHGLFGNPSSCVGKFQNLSKVIIDLDYVNDDWSSLFYQEETFPSVHSLEITNASFLRKESEKNLGEITASFPNLKNFKSCDPHGVLQGGTDFHFLKFIWKHLSKLESLEFTLGKKALSHGRSHSLDSAITRLSLSTCALMFDSEKTSEKIPSEPSILSLLELQRFSLHLDDLSCLIHRNKDYPMLSKVVGQFAFTRMPNLRVKIYVPSSLLEKARETSISPFVTFVGE